MVYVVVLFQGTPGPLDELGDTGAKVVAHHGLLLVIRVVVLTQKWHTMTHTDCHIEIMST